MKLLDNAAKGATQALSVKNIVYMVLITIIVTLILSYVLKIEIVLYDTHGRITGYGDVKPRLKKPETFKN